MGQMFKSLGLLPFDDVMEVSASDLVTGYAGQAGKKTQETLQRAKGRVLFIDEAYQLVSDFDSVALLPQCRHLRGTDSIPKLLPALTHEGMYSHAIPWCSVDF